MKQQQQQINSYLNKKFQIKPPHKTKKIQIIFHISLANIKNLNHKQLNNMHQISLQDLSLHIPNKVINWSSDDICTWLSLNQIDINHNKIKQQQINGANIKKLTPMYWIQKYGLTKFIARQIVQWLDEDAEQFDLIVQQNSKITDKNQNQQIQIIAKDNKVDSLQNSIQNNFYQQFTAMRNSIICQEENTSKQLHLNNKIQSQQQQKVLKLNLLSQKQNKSSINHSSPFSKSKSSSSSSDNEGQDQITSLQGQGKVNESQDKYQQLSMQRIHSEVTQRLQQKKYKNNPQIKSTNSIKQKDLSENQNLNVGKWALKKKEDTKSFNQRLKNKHKQINKNPKFYNYFNQNIAQGVQHLPVHGMGKRMLSAQQISNPSKKLFEANQFIIPKQKSKNQIVSEPIIGNPFVKFVSSQFIPFASEKNKNNLNLYEKSYKITALDFEKTLKGYAKIGRFKQNEIIFIDQTVSRQHAQISSIYTNGQTKYFLKDIGSKFGTFVQSKGIQQNIQGKSFLIGDAQIQIVSIQLSKQIPSNGNLTNKRPTFDLKVKIDKQKQLNLLNRSLVTIGKKTNNDIRIDNNCANAKIWIQKDKKFYLEGIQGKLYMKLKQHEQWDIQSHLDINKQVEVVFGWLKASIQVLQICKICGRKSYQCFCSARQESGKYNLKL